LLAFCVYTIPQVSVFDLFSVFWFN